MTDRLCKSEVFIALALLVLHIFLIPLLILGGSMFWGWDFWGLNDTWLNFIYYSFSNCRNC